METDALVITLRTGNTLDLPLGGNLPLTGSVPGTGGYRLPLGNLTATKPLGGHHLLLGLVLKGSSLLLIGIFPKPLLIPQPHTRLSVYPNPTDGVPNPISATDQEGMATIETTTEICVHPTFPPNGNTLE
jgi:hypothetical protein